MDTQISSTPTGTSTQSYKTGGYDAGMRTSSPNYKGYNSYQTPLGNRFDVHYFTDQKSGRLMPVLVHTPSTDPGVAQDIFSHWLSSPQHQSQDASGAFPSGTTMSNVPLAKANVAKKMGSPGTFNGQLA